MSRFLAAFSSISVTASSQGFACGAQVQRLEEVHVCACCDLCGHELGKSSDWFGVWGLRWWTLWSEEAGLYLSSFLSVFPNSLGSQCILAE